MKTKLLSLFAALLFAQAMMAQFHIGAKAGANIITITGYTGGTGAARMHSLRHVGLPEEIGVWLAHHALLDSGLQSLLVLHSMYPTS